MIFEQSSYRDFLRAVLAERSRTNPRYSLRSFARQMGVQPSLLSLILSGKRKLTEETAERLSERLALGKAESNYFRLLVQLDRAKSPALRSRVLEAIREIHPRRSDFHELGVDQFKLISEWHHFALLILMAVRRFEWTTHGAAQALGLQPYEVDAAVQRMARLGLVKFNHGRPEKLPGAIQVSSEHQSEALRKYHAQMFERAARALETQAPAERYTGTENIVLDEEQLPEARKIFNECFDRIIELAKSRKERKSNVYHVGIQAFRLSDLDPILERKKKP